MSYSLVRVSYPEGWSVALLSIPEDYSSSDKDLTTLLASVHLKLEESTSIPAHASFKVIQSCKIKGYPFYRVTRYQPTHDLSIELADYADIPFPKSTEYDYPS